MTLEPHFNVLDIGAGPGTMALPMARRAARLTAVEPAAGTADLIEALCRDEGIGNIHCIRKRWQDLDPEADLDGSYHVVVAAFSLGVDDLQSAIEKMNRASMKLSKSSVIGWGSPNRTPQALCAPFLKPNSNATAPISFCPMKPPACGLLGLPAADNPCIPFWMPLRNCE